MPFERNAELPERIRKLSDRLQTVFRKAFNSADAGICKGGGRLGDREQCSFAVANRAVANAKNSSEATIDGIVLDTITEMARDMSNGNGQSMEFVEQFERGTALREARIDRDGNLISNVKLLGKRSANARVYSDKAMQDAVRLYDGAPFYLDHPRESDLRERQGVRSVLDLAGKVVNPRKVGDEVRGDLHVLDREPVKGLVFALAEQMPEMAGNSHRAVGTIRRDEDQQIDVVEGLEKVLGMELVTDPATTSGLFESVRRDDDMKTATLEQLKRERPDLVEAILEGKKGAQEMENLRKENADLKKKVDESGAKEAERERQGLIADKLKKAELPETLVTKFFKKQLQTAKDEAEVDALITERQELAKQVPDRGPRSRESDPDKKSSKGKKAAVDEKNYAEYETALFG